jgi:hypothetical protein
VKVSQSFKKNHRGRLGKNPIDAQAVVLRLERISRTVV